MKYLIQRIKCVFGYHNHLYLPSRKGIMHGIFGPYICKCCGYYFAGFPEPDFSD